MKKSAIWLAALCACILLLAGMASFATPQSNANVAGTWTLTMAPMQGGGGGGGGGGNRGGGGGGGGTPPAPPTVTFKQDGTKLSGTQSGGRGGDVAIDGSVAGMTVTWTVKRNMRGTDVTLTYKGTVDGDNMKGTMTSTMENSQPRDFTATRNK
ncbi:MAG TPA: hypothetical protein VLV89_11640 [Candidatus Acidoferrum sp.]|nr:hypothetical protein [Candidatus Acidoferrum sp.]